MIVPDEGGVAEALGTLLGDRGVEVLLAEGTPQRESWADQVGAWKADGPITGVFWLAALDRLPIAGRDADDLADALQIRVKLLASTMRVVYDDMGAGSFLITGVRLGGRFGYDRAGAQDVLGGATSGFTKAFAREREEATVKVIDVTTDAAPADVAALLLAETANDPQAIEVGYADGLRWGIGLAESDVDPDTERALGNDDVIVVTGAAGSIVSAITADLAAASGGTFHLIDLTPEPVADDPDLERFVDDRDGLKTDLAQRITQRGERATPALVERELARLERARAALDAIRAVESAGGVAHWYQADLTDADAVRAAIDTIVERSDRVDVLLHCAGLEISRFLPDKTDNEYDLVFDVKAGGWFNLLAALGDTPLGAAVVFSSIAGRFGNGGQTDYSAANDLLCKSVSAFRTDRPATRGVAIDWTAWADIGMASRGSIPKMMAMAGIDMLPPEVGIPVVRRELVAAGAGGEVVAAGALGVMVDEPPTGGLDPAAAATAFGGIGPMLGTPIGCTLADGLIVRTTLTVEQPFLDHHRIDGTPVLPGVMGIESFVEAASALAPGWQVRSVQDVSFLAPFKLYRDEPREAEIRARLTPGRDGTLIADCMLVGRRTLVGQPEQATTHFVGRVVLAPPDAEHQSAGHGTVVSGPPPDTAVGADDIYRVYFHGPAYQVLAEAWMSDGTVVGTGADDLPPHHIPADLPLSAWPRLVELCFQTAGVHQLGTTGEMALPARVARIDLGVDPTEHPEPSGPLQALVTPGDDGSDAVVLDADGTVVVALTGYTTIVLPGGLDDELARALRNAMEP